MENTWMCQLRTLALFQRQKSFSFCFFTFCLLAYPELLVAPAFLALLRSRKQSSAEAAAVWMLEFLLETICLRFFVFCFSPGGSKIFFMSPKLWRRVSAEHGAVLLQLSAAEVPLKLDISSPCAAMERLQVLQMRIFGSWRAAWFKSFHWFADDLVNALLSAVFIHCTGVKKGWKQCWGHLDPCELAGNGGTARIWPLRGPGMLSYPQFVMAAGMLVSF